MEKDGMNMLDTPEQKCNYINESFNTNKLT